jgi:hypothetical protein
MAKNKVPASHNGIQNFVQGFKHPFTVEPAYIDCREMSQNYSNGLIPLLDVARGVDAVIGPWQGRINKYFGLFNLVPYFEEVDAKHVFSHPAFQRDTSPNHCGKLERDWFDQFAMVSLGLKMPKNYGDIVLNADSTHTSVNRIRQGMKKLPFWVADVPDQGDFDSTFNLALLIAGHMFLAINWRNKRGMDIFDKHYIQVSTNIWPAPQIQAAINSVAAPPTGVQVKRAGNRIPYAIHNLNEVYETFGLDEGTKTPGKLLQTSLTWLVRNFKHQSIDGCLMTSFAMFIQENEDAGIVVSNADADKLAKELQKRYGTANQSQLAIKKACLLLNKNRPGYQPLDSNYVVSNGLKHIAKGLKIGTVRDQLAQWDQGF